MTQAAIKAEAGDAALIGVLAGIVGPAHVLAGEAERVFFSTDMASQGPTALCVVQPGTRQELAQAVSAATAAGCMVIPRGGGYSYTGGYRPVREGAVTIDMRRLNRIVEINIEDMYVTVECGCTWRELYEALKAKGYRTPYFGPMSGYWATIGGALSQGSFFLGSTQYGSVADSVLSLEVVLADGSVIRTGTAGARENASPFYRWYGPDLAGLFLSDTGALGFKATATFRLIPWPQHQRFATFAFDNLSQSVALVSAVGRTGVAAECYCWDPTFVKSVGERSGVIQDIRYLAGVVGSGSSLFKGIKDAARMAMAGKRVFDGSTYLVHVTIDDVSDAGAEEKLKLVQAIAAKAGGGEVEPSAPRATRAVPFTDMKTGPLAGTAIRNLPTNSLCPHSKAQAVAAAVDDFFKQRKPLMEPHGITHGVIVFAVGASAICIEPLMFWNDEQHRQHDRVRDTSDLDGLARFDGPLPAARTVVAIRKELTDLFTALGCAHVQIGKSYRYHDTRQPDTLRLIEAVKQAVDPRRLVNPGSLGL